MNPATKTTALPCLTTDILNDPMMPVDNLLARLWKTMAMKTLLSRAGFSKRSGASVSEVVYLLLMWVWLRGSSIHLFSRTSLESFSVGQKDVMYDFLKSEDVNWRALHRQVAERVYRDHNLKACELKALVVDDTVKIRRGKRMAGVSRHFDHLTGRSVKGHQILSLGLATESTFLPLDQDIFISQKQVQEAEAFNDKRHIAAKRYEDSLHLTKPELLASSVKRVMGSAVEADYFLSDAWFGNKPTIRLTEECGLTGVLRMKKDKTKYRYTTYEGNIVHHQMQNAAELFRQTVRKQWESIPGTPYQAKVLDVELNLAEKNNPDQWRTVRLLFVRGTCGDEKPQSSKHDWALFLSTSRALTPQKMLEIYALRWGIEVYFKECKQHLGFLKEQTISFASHIASISLAAIRYLILLYAALEQSRRPCEVRRDLSEGLLHLSFGQRLWGLFSSLINGTLEFFRAELGNVVDQMMVVIEQCINDFFTQALQLDFFTLALEAKPDKL